MDQFANRCYMALDKILRMPVTANAEALAVGLGDIVLVWDRLPPHGSRITQQFIRDQEARIQTSTCRLPELNPVGTSGSTVRTMNCPTFVPRTLPPRDLADRRRGDASVSP